MKSYITTNAQNVLTRIGKAALLAAAFLTLFLALPCWAGQNYKFEVVATLGDPAPGPEGGQMANYFWMPTINDRSEVAFDAGVTTGGEGIFLWRDQRLTQVVRSGEPAPGGGIFDAAGVYGIIPINNAGDAAFGFTLTPFSEPWGMNAGLYRYSHKSGKVTAAMVPFVTPAPGGGTFQGAYLQIGLNNRGDLVFGGIIPTDQGIDPAQGLGMGVFLASKDGRIFSIASPGDPAPDGKTFDFAENPSINNRGDVAFGAHVKEDPCIDLGYPQNVRIFCAESVYVKDAASGQIRSVAHQGDPAPCGGTYWFAWGPVINDRGQVLFIGALLDNGGGVFLDDRGVTIPVARTGDPMPGGGEVFSPTAFISNYQLNNPGDVAFNATLTTFSSGGLRDQGLYVWSRGSLSLVARTGTVVPNVGTIAALSAPAYGGDPLSWLGMNDKGQLVFQVLLTDGRGVLLVATPQ